MPRGKEDLILQISNSYMTVFDNINRLREEYNDIFCQLVTGGNFLKRKLYTDSDIVAYSLQCCLILNGINYLTNQPDLLDRSIVIPLRKISSCDRKTEQELSAQFKKNCHTFYIISFKRFQKQRRYIKIFRLKISHVWQTL